MLKVACDLLPVRAIEVDLKADNLGRFEARRLEFKARESLYLHLNRGVPGSAKATLKLDRDGRISLN